MLVNTTECVSSYISVLPWFFSFLQFDYIPHLSIRDNYAYSTGKPYPFLSSSSPCAGRPEDPAMGDAPPCQVTQLVSILLHIVP